MIFILQECLQQEIDLIDQLTEDEYRAAAIGPYDSSVGKHIRHNLDHFSAFFSGCDGGRIDYETRQRNQHVEESTAYCREQVNWCRERLNLLQTKAPRSLLVRLEDGAPLEQATWVESSQERELQFLLGHTVHHHAIIAMLLSQQGVSIPDGFGVAPSTQRFEQKHSALVGA